MTEHAHTHVMGSPAFIDPMPMPGLFTSVFQFFFFFFPSPLAGTG